MKVIILCGGKGTRLREETEYRPKPMVPIGGRPILWHIMKTYAHYGHKDFILCLGYKGEMIKDFFRNYHWHTADVTLTLDANPTVEFHGGHDEEDWRVTLADTRQESLTARRIKSVQKYLTPGEPFLMTYGDGVSNIDINASIDEHRRGGKLCTVSAVHPAGRFGSMRLTENGAIEMFQEKPQSEAAYINGGFMICEPGLFSYLPEKENVMFERAPIMNLLADGQLHSYRHEGWWQPMDTYQECQHLNQLWDEGKAPWKVW